VQVGKTEIKTGGNVWNEKKWKDDDIDEVNGVPKRIPQSLSM